jgi:hypothetical protein
VSTATRGRMTERLKITVKKNTIPPEKETERVQLLRYEFWQQVRSLKVEDLIFIEESGVNLAMVRLYARSLRGRRARVRRPHK